MRVVAAHDAGVAVLEISEPVPGAGQVLVAPLACGICGSDLHVADEMRRRGQTAPRILLGHEFCAKIVAFGPGTEQRLPLGSRVVSMPLLDMGTKVEPIGLSARVPGGFAERMLLDEKLLLPVPEQVPDEYAALVEPLAVGIRAVNAAALRDDDVALVLGCGPIGGAVIAALKLAGHRVVASDPSPSRRNLATALGADVVVDPDEETPFQVWRDLGARALPYSPALTPDVRRSNAVIFECVGNPGMLQHIIDEAPGHARVVCVGVCMQPDTIRPNRAIAKELSITFAFAYRPEEFREALDMISTGRINSGQFISGVVPLDGATGAFADLRTPDKHIKLLIRPQD